jgi:hypothetical protein
MVKKMKYEPISAEVTICAPGDTADLRRCVWLTPMKGATRSATLASLGSLCEASGFDGEPRVDSVRRLIAGADPEVREAVGKRWTQIASDVRRALRCWDHEPTRWLAQHLRGRVPTLTDAATAGSLHLGKDEAKRAVAALEALASSQSGTLDELPATMGTVESLLRAATPETFGVAGMKTLENKRTLIRKVVRLVDPVASGMRETSKDRLPLEWREKLEALESLLQDHEKSVAAILRRFANFSAGLGIAPGDVDLALHQTFVAAEVATHASGYIEKLRSAFRHWNAAVDDGIAIPRLPVPGVSQHRQEIVYWMTVPMGIRKPVDAYLDTTVSVRNPGDWGDFVPEDDPEYAELGVGFVDMAIVEEAPVARVLEKGTHKNWRDAVKRAWHAASTDPRVQPKPEVLSDLFSIPVVTALVAATRRARLKRLEVQGRVFDPKEKGRYEHSIVESLHSVGTALEIPSERLKVVEDLKRQIDPAVISMKRCVDGTFKRTYAKRRIGKRHAIMLAAFNDTSCLKRWLETPTVLWAVACKPIWSGRKPQMSHVALARSALIARIAQFVAPIRRTNHARLRHEGPDRHIVLSEGNGEGTLIIPPEEGKTLREVHVRIDTETVRMLKYYIKHFLPVAQKHANAAADNPHLFPGADGAEIEDGGYAPGHGFHTKSKLNTTFKRHIKKYCGLDLCLHVMRHLAGKIILDQDPSAMSLVQEILGHMKIETTQSYYAEVSGIVAQRRYTHLLERQTRQVLATISFRFVDPQTGKEF